MRLGIFEAYHALTISNACEKGFKSGQAIQVTTRVERGILRPYSYRAYPRAHLVSAPFLPKIGMSFPQIGQLYSLALTIGTSTLTPLHRLEKRDTRGARATTFPDVPHWNRKQHDENVQSANRRKHLKRPHTGDPCADEVVHPEGIYVSEIERCEGLSQVRNHGLC